MALTGAGGAALTIPLLIHFAGMTLVESTVYSIALVIVSAGMNAFLTRKDIQATISILLALGSIVGSWVLSPYKSQIPDTVIAGSFSIVCALSFFSVLKSLKSPTKQSQPHDTQDSRSSLPKALFWGFSLGIVSTLTGLGGGVVAMTVLLGMNLSFPKAAATSALTISLVSAASFFLQWHHGVASLGAPILIGLISGSLSGSIGTQVLMSRMKIPGLDRKRKIVLIVLLVFAMISVFVKPT